MQLHMTVHRLVALAAAVCAFSMVGIAQDTVRVVTYNLLNYSTSDNSRDVYYRTVIRNARPDVLVLQELTSQAAFNQFFNNVVNAVFPGEFQQGSFIDGPDSDNGICIRQARFTFVSNRPIQTALRDISEFTVYHPTSAETLRVYSVHLRSSTGSTNEAARAAEVDSLRKVTNLLPNGSHFLVVGDFNIYGSAEAAYQKLLLDNPADDGHVLDALTLTGTWNNSTYALHHTQSTRTRAFGGGATGGLDDRFDMILFSRAIDQGPKVKYLGGSLAAFGNDGTRFNDSINAPRGTPPVLADSVLQALHYASDHLPVTARFIFQPAQVPVQLASFSGSVNARGDSILLQWRTLTETNNFGFEVERKRTTEEYFLLVPGSFVAGHGTTLTPRSYTFAEQLPGLGSWHYRLRQIDLDGTVHHSEPITIDIVTTIAEVIVPQALQVEQNFPNPFNPATTIRFSVPENGFATIKVFTVLGQELLSLGNSFVEPGMHSATFDAAGLSSGVYFYRLELTTAAGIQTSRLMRMVLVK